MASSEPFALWNLEQEGRALLSRLGRLQSFALQETMVPAASLSVEAQSGIEKFLVRGRKSLRQQIHRFLDWIKSRAARATSPAEAQRRFTLLRLRFNVILSHFDIFSEALSQRSEADNGVWLAGLDVVARDALEVPGVIDPPPVICYLARGPGAAIRRARTRLPGGESNPVAIIRVPRERMIGTGIASSLVHEVGHQGAALLDLVASLRADLLRPPPHIAAADGFDNGNVDASVAAPRAGAAWAWSVWRKWISEIVADFWSVARLGVTATSGLIGVVSLPAAFVFRIDADDPHPVALPAREALRRARQRALSAPALGPPHADVGIVLRRRAVAAGAARALRAARGDDAGAGRAPARPSLASPRATRRWRRRSPIPSAGPSRWPRSITRGRRAPPSSGARRRRWRSRCWARRGSTAVSPRSSRASFWPGCSSTGPGARRSTSRRCVRSRVAALTFRRRRHHRHHRAGFVHRSQPPSRRRRARPITDLEDPR